MWAAEISRMLKFFAVDDIGSAWLQKDNKSH